MIEFFIITGFVLLALSVLFALPFFGVGLILPLVGDIIDIPLSIIMALLGVTFLLIGGVVGLLTDYWYIWVAFLILWGLAVSGKLGIGIKRKIGSR